MWYKPPVEFRLLGPLEVREADQVVAVGGPRARALLAILLLHANEVMPADDLVYELWTKPPDTAGNSLQAHISRLRKALGSSRVVTQKPGYLLKLANGERDVERFEALVADGRQALANQEPVRAGAVLREALALWRGPALADLSSEVFATAEIKRLEEARVGALEERIEADLAAGLHAEVAPELELLTREHPLRDRLRGQLMLSLYRCGRQAEALEVYRATRRTLVDELGIEPSPALRRLETAMLLQDPKLELVQPASLESIRLEANAHLQTRMVGRDGEMAHLGQLFRSVEERRGCHLATVFGAPGIGKTRLAREFAEVLPRNAIAVVGRCAPNQDGSLGPVAEILKQLAADTNDEAIRGVLGGHEQTDSIASRLASALHDPTAIDAEDLSWAFRRLLEVLAQHRPHVIILDDLQWADERLLNLVDYVTEWSRDAALMFVCLARLEFLDRRPTWGASKANASVITLEPLRATDAEALLNALAGIDASTLDLQRMLEIAAGNPLFLEQTVALAVESSDEVSIPPTIPAIIRARLSLLPPVERKVLSCAAVMGQEFWVRAIEEMSDRSEGESLQAVLRRLVRKDFVAPDWSSDPGEEIFEFRHGLLRDVAYEVIPSAERARLHEAFANWLLNHSLVVGGEREDVAGQHLEEAYRVRRDSGDSPATEALARRASRLLGAVARREVGAAGLAARVDVLRRAAELARGDDALRADLLADMSADLQEMGSWEEAQSHYAEALNLATSLGDEALMAYLSLRLSQCNLRTDPRRSMSDFIDEGMSALALLENVGSSDYAARVRTTLGSAFIFQGKPAKAQIILEELLDRNDGGSMRLANVCRRLLVAAWLWGPAPADRAVTWCEEVLEGDPPIRVSASAYRSLALLHAMQGDFKAARTFARQDHEILAELGLRPAAAAATEVYAAVELLAGSPDRATELLEPAVDELIALSDAWYVGGVMSALAEALFQQGETNQAWHLTEKIDRMEVRDISVPIRAASVRARVLAVNGEDDSAIREAKRAVKLSSGVEMPNDRAEALFAAHEVFARVGWSAEAAKHAARAVALWDEKGNTVSARRARRMAAGDSFSEF